MGRIVEGTNCLIILDKGEDASNTTAHLGSTTVSGDLGEGAGAGIDNEKVDRYHVSSWESYFKLSTDWTGAHGLRLAWCTHLASSAGSFNLFRVGTFLRSGSLVP